MAISNSPQSTTEEHRVPPWEGLLSEGDRATLVRGGFSKRMGFGDKPAIIAIDCQRYMVGERGITDETRFPSSCGDVGWAAVDNITAILSVARTTGIPIFLTRYALDPSGSDIGVYGRKRTFLKRPDWCLEGTFGSELLSEIGPKPGDIVITKKKPSAFFGTPLLAYLMDRAVDTLVILGGATSNCVRATVFDSSSYNLRTIVAADAVFDRIAMSHVMSLFDMDRQFADVVMTADVIKRLTKACSHR